MAALRLLAVDASVALPQHADRVGDAYEITMSRDSSQQGSNGSSGSSHDQDTLIERVIGVRADGLELEYDLPKSANSEEGADNWQFPVRIFKPNHGSPQLVNRAELEARLDGWLKKARWPRTVCGHWIFTWNAFRIDCDPQSVVEAVEKFDLRASDLHEGASYQVAEARVPGTLRTKAGPYGRTFSAEMEADPDNVRHAQAASDVATGEIMHKPVTLDAALRERAKETISGTISITFDTDSAGEVRRRTKVTNLEIKQSDGRSETQTVTQTVERRLL